MICVATIVGARPQFVKAAVVSRALPAHGIRELLIHTGQHYDHNMSKVFFDELEMTPPDYNLGVGSGSHGAQTGQMLEAIERVLCERCPDWVLVYGDTNSTLAGALAAAKLRIPVAHVEAGLRSFNRAMPEEINRVLTDHVAKLLFAPTAMAVKNLEGEGIVGDAVCNVGDVMFDSSLYYGHIAESRSRILQELKLATRQYVLVTVHRAENTDDPACFWSIYAALREIARELPVIFPVHPRTRKLLSSMASDVPTGGVQLIDPVGYLDMLMLEKNAALIATDSGGVQKEAFFYRVPAVTLRRETEWVELCELGWNRLAPAGDTDQIVDAMRTAMTSGGGKDASPYGSGNAAELIASQLAAWARSTASSAQCSKMANALVDSNRAATAGSAAVSRTKGKALMLLSNAFDPDVRVYSEARSLLAAGYRVRILAWDRDRKSPRTEIVDGIDVERIYIRSTHGRGSAQAYYTGLVSLAMIVRACRREFDVVHAHDMDTLPAGYILSRLTRKPLIYDSHEDYAGMLHGSIPLAFENAIRRTESFLARRADLVITVGEILRRQFEARGCSPSIVIGNWKRLSEFEPDWGVRRRVREQLGIPEGALVVSYIAQLGRERRIAELLEAVHARPNVHLIVGGTGAQQPAVEAAAGTSGNIHYLGFVPPTQVPNYTIAADAVYYGFDITNPNARYSAPNKLFEALAAGCCVISGRFGEIENIVTKHDCGILVEDFTVEQLTRALDTCLDAQRLARWKQNAARAGREHYSWELAEQLLTAAYANLVHA